MAKDSLSKYNLSNLNDEEIIIILEATKQQEHKECMTNVSHNP